MSNLPVIEVEIHLRLHPGGGFDVTDGYTHVWADNSKDAIRKYVYSNIPCDRNIRLTIVDRTGLKKNDEPEIREFYNGYVQ